jgi:quercetin dioxygenase-like cupin family protein
VVIKFIAVPRHKPPDVTNQKAQSGSGEQIPSSRRPRPQSPPYMSDGSPQTFTTNRLLIAGVDASGRSCAARDDRITLQGDAGLDGITYSVLYATPSLPSICSDGGRVADVLDLAVPAGAMRWTMIDYAPRAAFSMHHTDTVDLDVVLSGSVDLILDDGEHPLGAGDSVVVTGVDHAWRAGPEGCRLSVMTIGAYDETCASSGVRSVNSTLATLCRTVVLRRRRRRRSRSHR